jgi:hypothetical protein
MLIDGQSVAEIQQRRNEERESPRNGELPELLRFRDLKAVGINNWVTLRRRIDKDGFPPGRLLGPKQRVWVLQEVMDWFNSRPTVRE